MAHKKKKKTLLKKPKGMDTSVRFVERNNKSRQGLYVEIKKPRKKKGIYKFLAGDTLDLHMQYYDDRQKAKGKRKIRSIQQLRKAHATEGKDEKSKDAWKVHERYLRDIRKRGTITDNIRPGVTQTIINPNRMNKAKVQKAYEELLGPLVLDKELLHFVIRNAQKFVHNFQYQTVVKGQTKQKSLRMLGKISDIGNRTIEKYLVDYILDDWKLCRIGTKVDYQWKIRVMEHLRIPKNNVEDYNQGTINDVKTRIIYTRGNR